jgi:hypothetical protein
MIPPIFATLSVAAPVTALIGSGNSCRCYPSGFAPQGTLIPYVTYQTISGLPLNKLTQGSFCDTMRAQVDCWGATGAAALALAQVVRTALEPVGMCVSLNLNDRDDETRTYRYSMDFEFIVNR